MEVKSWKDRPVPIYFLKKQINRNMFSKLTLYRYLSKVKTFLRRSSKTVGLCHPYSQNMAIRSTKSLVDFPLFFALLIYYVTDQVRSHLSNLRFDQDFRLSLGVHLKNVLFQPPKSLHDCLPDLLYRPALKIAALDSIVLCSAL